MTTLHANSVSSVRVVSPPEVKAMLDAGEVLLLDVREMDEHARERIAGSQPAPLSMLDPAAAPMPAPGRRLVVHCRSGARSADAAKRLAAAGRAEVLDLRGGLVAWKAAGLPVVRGGGTTISLMRQVQIVVGTCVLVASALAWLVSPWFLALTAFFGAGLLFAGATGICGLAAVLSLMPWNRAACGTGRPRA